AGGQDARSHVLQVEKQGMVQTRFENRRGAASVLSCSQHDDDVGRAGFVDFRLLANLASNASDGKRGGDGQSHSQTHNRESYPFHALCWAFRNIVQVSPQGLVSEKNPLLRDVRRAAGRGSLTDDGFALAEGPHLLEEALRSGVEIGAVIVAEGRVGNPPQVGNLPHVLHVSDAVFAGLSSTETPQ